jgi:type IV pilus assembly protein PilO
MALLPTKQRDQMMVLLTILAVAIVGLYWYFVFDPKSADIDKLAAHVDTLDMRNQAAKGEMAKGSIEQIREEARTSRENLDLMRTLVPAANEVSSLIDQISTAARRTRLDVGNLEPEPVIEGEMFDTYRYKMKMSGSYHDLAQMLTNVGSLNRIVSSINLSLNLQTTGQGAGPGKQMLTSSFEIQTYVVRTAPKVKKKSPNAEKAAAAAAAGGPPAGATPPGAPTTKKPPQGGGA